MSEVGARLVRSGLAAPKHIPRRATLWPNLPKPTHPCHQTQHGWAPLERVKKELCVRRLGALRGRAATKTSSSVPSHWRTTVGMVEHVLVTGCACFSWPCNGAKDCSLHCVLHRTSVSQDTGVVVLALEGARMLAI